MLVKGGPGDSKRMVIAMYTPRISIANMYIDIGYLKLQAH